ncbi:unnamed protein product [Haemonchus placei]|uniref:Histone domain-containing protein n=1 Tax=Haemonchus placei TaxID=6290 RepID=A0A0N4W9M7_HAEPC|nr:unnamed protein product [Haemonchus placei]
MVDEKDDIIIIDEVTGGKGNVINGTDTKGDSESGKDGAEVNSDKAWVPSVSTTERDEKESKDHVHVVVIDECGEGDEFLESAAKSAEQPEKASEENIQSQSGRRKKERTYKRKVVRLPREVFDYMAKIEEDGTIRLNLTQFAIFFSNEITKKFTAVPAESWITTDLVPMMDVSVPPTAKENQFLIVDNFSNEPKERAAQEKRLKDLLENRKRHAEQKEVATGAKILPADGKKKPQKNAGEQVKTDGTNEEKSPSNQCVSPIVTSLLMTACMQLLRISMGHMPLKGLGGAFIATQKPNPSCECSVKRMACRLFESVEDGCEREMIRYSCSENDIGDSAVACSELQVPLKELGVLSYKCSCTQGTSIRGQGAS